MNYRYLIFAFSLMLLFVLLPHQASSGFRIGGWLGEQLDKGKGLLGAPMELATQKSLEDMQRRLDANIDHLDVVMSKNVTLFTTQLDEVFKSTTERLDSLLQNNITDLNRGLAENIDNLDISIKETLATVRYEQSVFDQSLWVFTKMLAQLVLILLTVYFIFLTYSQLNKQGWKALFQKVRFYLIGLVLGIVIVFFFKPLTGSFIDKKFEKQKDIVKDKVRYSMSHWLLKDAIINTSMLTKYEPYNNLFEYGKYKALLVKELFLNSSTGAEGNEDLNAAYGWFNDAYNKYKPKDPEYLVLDGLFKKRFYHSKKGNFLAALSSLQYLKLSDTKLVDDLFLIGSLKPIAVDMISTYSINPYDSLTLQRIILENSLEVSPEDFHLLSGSKDLEQKIYTVWTSELANLPLTKFNENVYLNIKGEQDRLFLALTKGDFNAQNGNSLSMFATWMQQMADQKYWSHKALILDDAIDYGIRKYRPNNLPDNSEKSSLEKEVDNLNLPAEIKTAIDSLSIYKRLFLARAINQSHGAFAKAGKAALIIKESLSNYSKVDSLLLLNQTITFSGDIDMKIKAYSDLVRLAAELNLYYETKNQLNRLPLSFYFIQDAQNSIPMFAKTHRDLIFQWKSTTNYILERSFFDN